MNRTLKSLVLAMTLLAPASVFAHPADPGAKTGEHHWHHRGQFVQKIEQHAAELGIPQATVDKMKAAVEAARPDFQRLRQDAMAARQSDDLARLNAAETAMLTRRQTLRAQLHGMLTDQQRTAIKQMMERHRAERAQKSGD